MLYPMVLSEKHACQTSDQHSDCDCACGCNDNCSSTYIPARYPQVLSTSRPHLQAVGPEDCACDCDCDCHTPEVSVYPFLHTHELTTLLKQPYRLQRSIDQQLTLDDDYTLLYSTEHAPVLVNQSAMSLLEHFDHYHYDQPKTITRALNTARAVWGELTLHETLSSLLQTGLLKADTDPPSPDRKAQTLSAWLHITDRCNLRCSYCYLPHIRADMSAEIGRAAIDASFRSAIAHGYSQVKLKFAGGEALLCFPLIVELQRYAKEQAIQYNCQLDSVVLSNATLLTPDIIKTMQSLGMRLMISLDGLGRLHDQQRPYAGGRGSFADVCSAIDLALSYSLVPTISVTVTGASAAGLAELMQWIIEHELPFSLNFYRENERSTSHSELRLEEQAIIAGMQAAFDVIEAQLPRHSLLASLIDRSNLSAAHTHTCGVGNHYLVFDHKGRISKCQMHMPASVASIADEDPLGLIRADQLGVQNLHVDQKEGCRSCEWKHWCTGGCPVATFRATGRYDIQSPNCAIYKALYPEAMRLEGLRIRKYGGIFLEE